MVSRVKKGLLAAVEAGVAVVPRQPPPPDVLARARIVSHRGERDNQRTRENTFAAFDPLVGSGVWGIEFDVRWTRDLEPVVCHDPDLLRVFRLPLSLVDTDYRTLRACCPDAPHLGEFVERYGGRLHLMLELKNAPYPDTDLQQKRLLQHLSGLQPIRDFHILALNTDLYRHVSDLPSQSWFPVAQFNVPKVSAFALANDCAGMAGPYALIGAKHLDAHHSAGQKVGIGFPHRRNVLFRELARGADWIFSDHALKAIASLK